MTPPTPSFENQDLTTPALWNQQWDHWHDDRPRKPSKWSQWRNARKGRALMARLSQLLEECGPSPLEVLEVGCAPGSILAGFQQHHPEHHFHGVDYAQDGMAQTERYFAAAGIPATLHSADLREFEPPHGYDFVYSCGLIEHFADPVPIVGHHARLCSGGGLVVATVPNYAGPLQEWLMRRIDPEKMTTHNLEVMNCDVLRQIFQAAGLENVRVGGMGRGKFSVSCKIRNPWTHTLRFGAKAWNALHGVLPLAPGWPVAYWAAGRKPAAAGVRAA